MLCENSDPLAYVLGLQPKKKSFPWQWARDSLKGDEDSSPHYIKNQLIFKSVLPAGGPVDSWQLIDSRVCMGNEAVTFMAQKPGKTIVDIVVLAKIGFK